MYIETRTLENGVPKRSLSAPTLFNIYLNDVHTTGALKFGYADDWAIACQSHSFKTLETNVAQDVNNLRDFLNKWYLKMNKTKNCKPVFHLDNHQAAKILKIRIGNKQLSAEPNPKYLGVVLDRTVIQKNILKRLNRK